MGTAINPVASAEAVGASPAPTGSEVTAEQTPSPGVQQASGADSASAVQPESPNIRQLREQYENLKKEYDPYKSLGSVDDLKSQTGIAGKVLQTVMDLGTALGYTDAEIRQAVSEDPYGTYEFLRNKQKELETTGQPQDVDKLVEAKLNQRLKPFEQERQQRVLSEARASFDSTFEAQIKEAFKDEELSQDELSYIYTGAFRAFERDPEAVKMLLDGKTSGIVKHMQESINLFNKAYLARNARDMKRAGAQKPAGSQAPPSESKKSIDDFIYGNFDLPRQ